MSEEGPVEAKVEGRCEMITRGITKIASDTTAGFSSIVAEICEDLHESYIVKSVHGQMNALKGVKVGWEKDEGILVCVGGRAKQRVEINEMQWGFMSDHCIIDAILLYARYMRTTWLLTSHRTRPSLTCRKHLIMYHEMSTERQSATWESMFRDVKKVSSTARLFRVGVGVHQGSFLSPLLFITVLEALTKEFHTCCPWKLLYADELMFRVESMQELLRKMNILKCRNGEEWPAYELEKEQKSGIWH